MGVIETSCRVYTGVIVIIVIKLIFIVEVPLCYSMTFIQAGEQHSITGIGL